MYWTRIDERIVGDVVILDVRGRMTVSEESAPATETIRRLLAEGRTRILVNLTYVPFIDSLGLETWCGDSRRPSAPAGN